MILDVDRASLVRLDPWAAKVWRCCDSAKTVDVIAGCLGGADRVAATLQILVEAGIVRKQDDAWQAEPCDWV